MHPFLKQIHAQAKTKPARIVFAEGEEPRVQEAAQIISQEGLAKPILLRRNCLENKSEASAFFSFCPTPQQIETYAAVLAERRDLTAEKAREELKNPHMLASMMVFHGDADAMISGPSSPSHERILPILKIFKKKSDFHKVSGLMIMLLPDETDPDASNGGTLFFADCAVTVEPDKHELADIAIDTGLMAQQFGVDPKIAMLSFSTDGSSNHPLAKGMREAAKIAQQKMNELVANKQLDQAFPIEGEMQVDAALIDAIGERKAPSSQIAGHANVLIFPDLEAGNIAYKLVERLAGAKAIGPILQGLCQPANELSRGCSAQDIVNLAAFTNVQAQQAPYC